VIRFIILVYLYVTLPVAIANGDPIQGKAKAIICIGCHGIDGNNTNETYPILAGQSEAYLTKQLNDFKTGKRQEEHMSSMVEALTISDISDVSSYFATQKRKQLNITNKNTKQGEQIYFNGVASRSVSACVACHKNVGNTINNILYPILAGQHSVYIQKALKEFRSGKRHNDPDKTMRNIATKLTNKEIKAVADYITQIKLE